ncbi:MAG: glycosyltransferase family 4 protein [Janthinobacterium lividum]
MAFHTPGGGEIQLLQYLRNLRRRNVDVNLLDLWHPEFLQHDIVHFFSCMTGSLHFCSFVKSIGLPLVVSPNLWITEETRGQYPYDEIRTMFVLADRVICNSNAECDLLARVFNIERERFVTVYNGINRDFLKIVDPRLFRETYQVHGPFVLNVANVEPRKNQLNLVRAMKAHPELTLINFGGVRDPRYAEQCRLEGGEQVRFLGAIDHDSPVLRSAYAACSVFALPSTLETPGLAALEAFAGGASIVVTAEGCTREYFGDAAHYVQHDDVDAIAQALRAAPSRTEGALQRIVASANYTWEEVIGPLVETYGALGGTAATAPVSAGFLPIETEEGMRFAWTKASARFDVEPGVITGQWRTIGGGTADLLLDNEPLLSGQYIPADWTPFEIAIPPAGDAVFRKLGVDNISSIGQAKALGDPRSLGVALRALRFTPWASSVVSRDFLRAVDPEQFKQAYGLDRPFVLSIADVEPCNNQLTLVRALEVHPGLMLVNLGEIRDPAYAEQCLAEGGERVRFLGAVERDSTLLRSAYAACHVFASVGSGVDADRSALEAFAAGSPVVMTAQGSSGTYFGDAACHVRHDDVAAVAACLGVSSSPNIRTLQKAVAAANYTWEEGAVGLAASTARDRMRTGFLPVEIEEGQPFAWTRASVRFDVEPGVLRGEWRTIGGGTADILLDDHPIMTGQDISANWTAFEIAIPPCAGAVFRNLAIDNISSIAQAQALGDKRQLGVALRALRFTPWASSGVSRDFLETVAPEPFRQTYGVDRPFVLNVADVASENNQLTLVRALQAHPELILVNLGEIRDPAYAEQCVVEGGDRVRFLGPVERDAMLLRSAYAACRVLVSTSLAEAPDLPALEAFAAGTRVVVTAEEHNRPYFGDGARYVRPDDVHAISAALGADASTEGRALQKIVAATNYTFEEADLAPAALARDRIRTGFLPIEIDGRYHFAWTKTSVRFDMEPGVLKGEWRTVGGGTVDVSIDEQAVMPSQDIPSGWTPFEIVVSPKAGAHFRKVTIDNISTIGQAAALGDPRLLGVAMKALTFTPWSEMSADHPV